VLQSFSRFWDSQQSSRQLRCEVFRRETRVKALVPCKDAKARLLETGFGPSCGFAFKRLFSGS